MIPNTLLPSLPSSNLDPNPNLELQTSNQIHPELSAPFTDQPNHKPQNPDLTPFF